jgi:hypothetical protein
MNDIQPEVLLHLLCFQAVEIAEELDTTQALKKSLRTLRNFTQDWVQEFEQTETGSEYQARCIHNFNVVLNACTKDVLLTPIGDFEVKK